MAKFLGIDTAQVNCGYAIYDDSGDGSFIFCKTVAPPKELRANNMVKNTFQLGVLNQLLATHDIDFVALEAPAYSAPFQMISIGFIHGVIMSVLQMNKIPFIWVGPGQLKYALTGTAKADKQQMKDSAMAWFIARDTSLPKRFDDNQADAIGLAFIANWAYYALSEFGEKKKLADDMFRILYGENGILDKPMDKFWSYGMKENNDVQTAIGKALNG